MLSTFSTILAIGGFSAIAQSALAFWTLSFFIFWGAILFFCLLFAVNDKYWPIGLIWAITFLWLVVSQVIHPISAIQESPLDVLWKIALYLLVGLGWVIFRWVQFVESKIRPQRKAALTAFLKELPQHQSEFLKEKTTDTWVGWLRGNSDLNEKNVGTAAVEEWARYVRANGAAESADHPISQMLTRYIRDHYSSYAHAGEATTIPSWSDHKADYAAYWFYWPVDMVVYFLGTFLRDLWNLVSRILRGAFDRYAVKRAIRPLD